MDLNDYWQENKNFVLSVAAGFLAFYIGNSVIQSNIGEDVTMTRGRIRTTQSELSKITLTKADLREAERENEALQAAVAELVAHVGFNARPDFRLDPAGGSASNQYFAQVSSIREDLSREAGRLGVTIPDDLGLPTLAPTREDELARYLEAFDLVERVVRLSFETGVRKVDKIKISLDPKLRGPKGLESIERTRVKVNLAGNSGALVQLLAACQDASRGEVLLVQDCELTPERARPTEAVMEINFIVARPRLELEEDA
jgi:hypothetical protein